MLNIYEGALKIINPKLYNSPYKVNVFEVLNVIKNYKFRCRLIYLNNLLSLKIEEVPIEKLNDNALVLGATYETKKNKIELANNSGEVKIADNINHELFHTSSTRRNINTGIVLGGIGYNLTEGITEYLNLKSKNIKKSMSGYQLELFVIECLVFIYGEQILESYFLSNGKNFFEQFGDFKESIVELDDFLDFASNNRNCQFYRLFYLCLIDKIPGVFGKKLSFLNNLKLDSRSINLIKFQINRVQENFMFDDKIDVLNYKFNYDEFKTIYDDFVLEYNQIQKENFEKILNILITIALEKGISFENINTFVKTVFSFKNEEFRMLYEEILENSEKFGKER